MRVVEILFHQDPEVPETEQGREVLTDALTRSVATLDAHTRRQLDRAYVAIPGLMGSGSLMHSCRGRNRPSQT